MVSINTIGGQVNSKDILELYGLTSDEKPTKIFENCKIGNSSIFYCMDTKEVYLYDEENVAWLKQ